MYAWRRTSTPQHMLPGLAACALGTISYVRRDERNNKPETREAP